ncbi:MAG: hypothetical protein DRI97_02635 [Bacteroidetes bacterium]|nr:MAG: hypothetical protein DRI97_02635 [Bacteroidota bacterium]RLD71503.1 MAG: hypothetical protein DRI98_04970 [Bacteroidota bacterium]RLD93907.1 MAG: hypothetical protein DRJ29_07425 [Bacteroidota bacterium]
MLNAFIDAMRINLNHTSYIAILLLILSGCEINQNEIMPEDGFMKIYNHPDEQLALYPESVLELPEGGYIFISAVKDENAEIEYPYASLVRTSKSGELIWTMDYAWLAPTSKLILQNGSVSFVAMNQQFNAYVISIDLSNGMETAQHALDMTMPLAAYSDAGGNLVVLGYDFVTRSSWISKYNSNFQLQRSNKLPVNTDLEYLVQRHLNKTGQDYPFFIGAYSNTSGTGYFVNCFYNYTLRTVFLDVSSLGATGDIYSFQTEEGISSIIQKSGSLFGLTSYYEGNNYIIAGAEVDVLSSGNIKDLPAEPLYELTYRAAIMAGSLITDEDQFALYISQTNDNSLVVYQYALETDSLINTFSRKFDEGVEVRDFVQTADQGIAILANIYTLGKYKRPLLLKLDPGAFVPEE